MADNVYQTFISLPEERCNVIGSGFDRPVALPWVLVLVPAFEPLKDRRAA
jgi:hypothetical protein